MNFEARARKNESKRERPEGERPEAVLHVRRDDLLPDVRQYTDNLKAQILEILREVNVKDIGAYEQLVREKSVSEAKVRALKGLYHCFKRGGPQRAVRP